MRRVFGPALRIGSRQAGPFSFFVRLHNDGAGVAFNVRFTVRAEDSEHDYVIPSVRAMRDGETCRRTPSRTSNRSGAVRTVPRSSPWLRRSTYGDLRGS